MFILREKSQLKRAIEKAKQVRPKVHFINFGHYQVSGSKGFYTVICKKSENGLRVVECRCKAADKNLVCYHAAAALAIHTGLAKLRQINRK